MTKQQFLQDLINTFSKHPIKMRCKNAMGCYYAPQEEGQVGCAIGKHLPLKNAEKIDAKSHQSDSIVDILEDEKYSKLIPQKLKKFGEDFLMDMQGLHDDDSYWKEDGFSIAGVAMLKTPCTKHGINFKKLKF